MQKHIIIILILAPFLALGSNFSSELYHYHNGLMWTEDAKTPIMIEGPISISQIENQVVTIAGLHVFRREGRDGAKTPFLLSGLVSVFRNGSGGNYTLEAPCQRVEWGLKTLENVTGLIRARGIWGHKAVFSAWCTNPNERRRISMIAHGMHSKSEYYPGEEAAMRAEQLLGESTSAYKPVHVVNYALRGYPYEIRRDDCRVYSEGSYKTSSEARPGLVILGKDSKHCGVVDRTGKMFIHADPGRRVVASTPLGMAKRVFPCGFVFKVVE